jgi:hypothetical protein
LEAPPSIPSSASPASGEIIGPGFDRIGEWASAIPHSKKEPGPSARDAPVNARVCTSAVAGVRRLTEQIAAYNPDEMSLTYVATAGMPRFVSRAANTWTVTPTITIALVVGTILFCINQLDVVVRGDATATVWIKSAVTYVVPFCVANAGVLVATRHDRQA